MANSRRATAVFVGGIGSSLVAYFACLFVTERAGDVLVLLCLSLLLLTTLYGLINARVRMRSLFLGVVACVAILFSQVIETIGDYEFFKSLPIVGGIPTSTVASLALGTGVILIFAVFYIIVVELGLARDAVQREGKRLALEVRERERAEEELTKYRDSLEDLVRERTRDLELAQANIVRAERVAALGELTATVSHELRNPLGTIQGCLFILRQAYRDGEPREAGAIARAERNVERCNRIIEELLEFTQVKSHDPVTVDCDAWLDRALADHDPPDGVELSVSLHSPATIDIDPRLMKRCVEMLLSNAYDAVNEPGHEKKVMVSTVADEESVELSIRDTGIGIPPENTQHIWEPLFTTKGFGVGLGLSHVRHIVDLHAGTIRYTSDPGHGTAFTITLPRHNG